MLTGLPLRTPLSTRTPVPSGTVMREIVPTEGRKFRV